jgi:hypothetical protein
VGEPDQESDLESNLELGEEPDEEPLRVKVVGRVPGAGTSGTSGTSGAGAGAHAVLVVRVLGEINDVTPGYAAFYPALDALIGDGRHLVVDMSGAMALEDGMGGFWRIAGRLRQKGGGVIFVNPSRQVRRWYERKGAAAILGPLYDTAEEALAAIASSGHD